MEGGRGTELAFVTRTRRAIHRRPELAHDERLTAAFVERVLRALGLQPVRPAPTSVAVLLGSTHRRPVVGLRADLDAVRVPDATRASYTSRTPGLMHACGHDGHCAALLTLARRLAARPPRCGVLLVFQQAEEGHPSGAPDVIAGLPPAWWPTEFYAFHLWPELESGVVGLRTGPLMASVAGVHIEVHADPGAPGARAASGADAVAAAVELYRVLDPSVGRAALSRGAPSTLGLGILSGGETPNGDARHCRIEGTLRAVSWAEQDAAVAGLRSAAEEVARLTGTRIDVTVETAIRPPVVNTVTAVARLRAACEVAGVPSRDLNATTTVSEDFGWFLERSEGAMFLLGCGGPGSPGLHDPAFDFDEQLLLSAVDVLGALVKNVESEM